MRHDQLDLWVWSLPRSRHGPTCGAELTRISETLKWFADGAPSQNDHSLAERAAEHVSGGALNGFWGRGVTPFSMMLRAPVFLGSTGCPLMTQRGWCVGALIVMLMALTRPAIASAEGGLPQKTLAECVAIALEHHPTLKAASATIDAAHQRVWQAAAPYLPQLDLIGTRVYEQQSAGSAIGVPTGGQGTQLQRFYFSTATASFSQLLFDFGQTLAAIRSAQATERSVEADRTTTRDTAILNVKQAYFNVLATRRLLRRRRRDRAPDQKQLEQAQGRQRRAGAEVRRHQRRGAARQRQAQSALGAQQRRRRRARRCATPWA